ncbi:MAG: NAD-binding protein, partial [Desulfurococcales archaeon]|nr:NAD-binding protein [Desulfurococcales archaeon]
ETQPREEPPVDYIVGEISERSMRRAGIDRAEHVIICYEDDSKNIHASALVRKINPKAKITTVVKDRTALDILVMLGVDYVLPLSILGRLLVSTTFEPSVTKFIADAASARGGADLVEIEGEGGKVEELEEKHHVRAIAVVEDDGSVRPVRRGETIPKGKRVVAVREAEED